LIKNEDFDFNIEKNETLTARQKKLLKQERQKPLSGSGRRRNMLLKKPMKQKF